MTRTRATRPADEPPLRSALLYFAAVRSMQKAGPKIGTGRWAGALGGTRTPNLLIRRSRHIVQDRPSRSVCWADIPELSARDSRCPTAWQQYWQQSRRTAMILDRLLFRPDISQVAADRASVVRCRRSLALAVGRCCCCHRCCQRGAGPPVASRPAPCRGWPASGPGRLLPGPWFLSGVSIETPGSSVTSRVGWPVPFHLCWLSCGHSRAWGWRGGHVHSAGHPWI
jgi:hypothetical protein